MPLITRSELRTERVVYELLQGAGALRKALNENVMRQSRPVETTVFLSHKHNETEELMDAVALLKGVGAEVYIDHMDVNMPAVTSVTTAQLLKQKIRENEKFILLATEKSISSKWCNWELGYADAFKYVDNMALLLVREDDSNWAGSEYLGIYPVIMKNTAGYGIAYPNGSGSRTLYSDLEYWLKD